MPHALLVEDDPAALKALTALVERRGFSTATAVDLQGARRELANGIFDTVMLDVHLPGGSGIDLLLEIPQERRPQVVLMSGDDSVRAAFSALPMKELYFVQKPIDFQELTQILKKMRRRCHSNAGQSGAGSTHTGKPSSAEPKKPVGSEILGESAAIRRILTLIRKVAPTELSVYVEGESGTGKELVARAIHAGSSRSTGPFVAINCGALPENLIDSELFGHERGAFTGAESARQGVFEQANGGTLFLDEIAEMPVELQVRLLRTLETRCVRRVGGKSEVAVDVRIVAATNRAFDQAIADGTLREDLFHRLCVFPIAVPPLRDRGDDVVRLALGFLREFHGSDLQLTERVVAVLRRYSWPGNIRQLRNAMQRAVVLIEGEVIKVDSLPEQILLEVGEEAAEKLDTDAATDGAAATEPAMTGSVPTDAVRGELNAGGTDALGIGVGTSIAEAERRLIEATLESLDGDKKSTAEVLGVSLRTLYNRLSEYDE
jgi:DNA-binding NtrC family response regulator